MVTEQTPAEHDGQAPEDGHEDQDQAGGAAPTLEGLNAKVDGLAAKLDRLLSGPAPAAGSPAEAERSVAQEVRDELAKLQQAEARKRESAAKAGKLADLEAKVKKITEQPPQEYRRSTRVMGWHK